MKRTVSFVICLAAIIHMAFSASATTEIRPFALGANAITAQLKISNGEVTASGRCITSQKKSVKIYVYLQKQIDHQWVLVSFSSSNRTASVSCSATKGVTYRCYVVGRFYERNGKLAETLTKTSSFQTY